jgi:putative colanic acid biosynthesis acetyltransferase WcaF
MNTRPDEQGVTKEQRAQSPYSPREKVARVLWMLGGSLLFRCTFHNWYGLRASLLRLFGASIGPRVRVRASVTVEQPWNLSIGENSSVGDRAILYCLGKVTIGRNVSISQGAHLCAGTHDYRKPDMPLIRPPITVEDDAWIAADAFVGPRVVVGGGAILGARGVAMQNLQSGWIYAGNPAVKVKPRGEGERSTSNSQRSTSQREREAGDWE